jgi:transposase
MSIKRFERLVSNENYASRHIRKLCRKNGHIFCTRCGCRKVIRLRDGRHRCKRCKYSFGEFTGRYIGLSRLSPKRWLWLIKLFSLEVSTRIIARELGMNYKTALNATDVIRESIIYHASDYKLSGRIELDESYFGGRRKGKRGRGAGHKVPVFGILERRGRVSVTVVPNVSAETLLGLTVKKVKRGSIVYTDKWKSYDALMFCGYRHMNVDHGERFASGKVHINGLEGFWSFAKQRLAKFHGVSPRKFPLYLKEMEFRYNHRDDDIFEIIANYMVKLVVNCL